MLSEITGPRLRSCRTAKLAAFILVAQLATGTQQAATARSRLMRVDFESASREVQDACTQIVYQPMARQGGSFGSNAHATVVYDIDEKGNTTRLQLDEAETYGTGHVKIAALQDARITRFQPPNFEGQALYCMNVRERLDWWVPGWGRRAVSKRRANWSRSFEW